MLDISDPRVRQIVFNWFETVNKGGFDKEGLWTMTDAFLKHLTEVEADQKALRTGVVDA